MDLKNCIFVLLAVVQKSEGRDALNFFVKNKKVSNIIITTLDDDINSTNHWIEYDYYFNNNDHYNTSSIAKVGVYLDQDYDFDCRLTDQGVYAGYSIDIIEFLQETLYFQLEYVLINETTSLQNLLLNKQIDIAICHNHNLEASLDSRDILEIYPTFRSKYLLIYDPIKLNFTKDIFILTFAGSLWLVFLILLIVLAIFLRISTKYHSTIHPKHEPWTWVEITLWAIAAACQQGLSYTPFGFPSCCIFLLGYLTAHLLYTGFAAAITSLLVQYDAYYKLDVLKMAEELDLFVLKSSAQSIHFEQKFNKISYVDNLDMLLKSLYEYKSIALIPEILINQFIAESLDKIEFSKYLTTKISYLTYSRGFLTMYNNQWRRKIQNQLSKLDEIGILKNALSRNLLRHPPTFTYFGFSSAGQEHVGSATYVIIIGISASILFLLCEFLFSIYRKRIQRKQINQTQNQ